MSVTIHDGTHRTEYTDPDSVRCARELVRMWAWKDPHTTLHVCGAYLNTVHRVTLARLAAKLSR